MKLLRKLVNKMSQAHHAEDVPKVKDVPEVDDAHLVVDEAHSNQ
ncbi:MULTISPECIES: hypothetical protein [Bacillus cereus group]|nr:MULTISPECIES: hypothetical protein [Bacillus cereus group]